MGKVTIQSMAKDLGLSRNTVSLALKDSPLVSSQTREMVLRHAGKLGYIEYEPRKEAIEPSKQTLYHIMILRKPEEAVYWDKVINGISVEAGKYNCQTHMAVITDEDEEQGIFPLGLDEHIQAVFCVKLMRWDYLKKMKDSGYHVFILDDYQESRYEPLGDVVRSEGMKTVASLTRHLLEQGMTRIGFLNEHSSTYMTMHDRYMGYLDAMQEAGVELIPEFVKPNMERDDLYEESFFDEMVGEFSEIPEAMVCGNDELAQFLTIALRKRGLRVPEDVAVTGFDNDEYGMLDPFFSTVHVNAQWLGRRMMQSFLWRMENPDAPYERIVISGEVIIRRSSCKNAALQGNNKTE